MGHLRVRFRRARLEGTLALSLLIGVVAAGAALAATTKWKIQHSPDPGGSSNSNYLYAVAATSAKNAWAVGY